MKQTAVIFASIKLEKEFESLSEGQFQDKQLHKFINRAIQDLKQKPSCGIKIPKQIWSKTYKQYKPTNLWKYNLPSGWRLIYTIKSDEVTIYNIILEWFSHKQYEKKFKY